MARGSKLGPSLPCMFFALHSIATRDAILVGGLGECIALVIQDTLFSQVYNHLISYLLHRGPFCYGFARNFSLRRLWKSPVGFYSRCGHPMKLAVFRNPKPCCSALVRNLGTMNEDVMLDEALVRNCGIKSRIYRTERKSPPALLGFWTFEPS